MKKLTTAFLMLLACAFAGNSGYAQQYDLDFEVVELTAFSASGEEGKARFVITYKLLNSSANPIRLRTGEELEIAMKFALQKYGFEGSAKTHILTRVEAESERALYRDGAEIVLTDTFTVPGDAMALSGGGDVVVVWPTGPKVAPCEPKSFTIDFENGPVTLVLVDESDEETYVYPNPSQREIKFKSDNNTVTNVTIRDSDGNVVKEESDPDGGVNVDDLPPGTYWITITDENNDTHTLPIIISK